MPDSRDITAEDARVAAQIEAEVGVEHIAEVYAKGLLGATENAGQTAAVLAEFDALLTDVFDRFPRFETVLASAMISPEEKSASIDRVFPGRVSPTMVNFLKGVARHGRRDCLRAIHRRMHVLYDAMRQRIPARLTTAAPLGAAESARIVDNLRAMLGGEPILELSVDPNLIGGAVLRVGDVIYDGSIANQLNTLRQEIIDRSAHEIQGRRDRFRNPAGN